MKQIELVAAPLCILRIEGLDAGHGGRDDGVVTRLRLRVGISEVAEQCEMKVRFAVREELDLNGLERLLHLLHAARERGYDDRRAELGGDPFRSRQVELGQRPRWQ